MSRTDTSEITSVRVYMGYGHDECYEVGRDDVVTITTSSDRTVRLEYPDRYLEFFTTAYVVERKKPRNRNRIDRMDDNEV